MYVPAHFAQTDPVALHEFIDQHPFGILISLQDSVPMATHLPFLLDRDASCLFAHVARQNPQWQQLAGQELLCIFNGPHEYISPTWYQAEKSVPTWNYQAVHVYGRATLIEEPAEAITLLQRLTQRAERTLPTPWTFASDDPFIRKLATQIVAFRIEIERIEGKWKLNQNHPDERRKRVIEALQRRGGDDANAIAEAMETTGVGGLLESRL